MSASLDVCTCRSFIEKRFREFLAEGGFPEAQSLTAALRIELLQSYVDSVLFRDVVERFELSRVTALRWLVRHCLRNPAGSFSVHRLPGVEVLPAYEWLLAELAE
jgi:uncharacterized protein